MIAPTIDILNPNIEKFLSERKRKSPFTVIGSFYLIDPDGKSELVWEKEQDALVVGHNELNLAIFLNLAQTVKDTGGTNRTSAPYNTMRCNAGAGNTNYGLVLGTGSGAYAPNQNALGTNNNTLIAHGTGAGNLVYGAVSFTAPTLSGSNYYWNCQRTFTNSSGGDITAEEMALYCYDGTYYYCIARDLTGGVLIADTKVGTGIYTFTTTV